MISSFFSKVFVGFVIALGAYTASLIFGALVCLLIGVAITFYSIWLVMASGTGVCFIGIIIGLLIQKALQEV